MRKTDRLLPDVDPSEVEGMTITPGKRNKVEPGQISKRTFNTLWRKGFIEPNDILNAGVIAESTEDEIITAEGSYSSVGAKGIEELQNAVRYLARKNKS
jgi:hypothetical protein